MMVFEREREKFMDSLKPGDTVEIIAPSWVDTPKDYEKYKKALNNWGFTSGLAKTFTKVPGNTPPVR